MRHGTLRRFRALGCRCDKCRKAQRDHFRTVKDRKARGVSLQKSTEAAADAAQAVCVLVTHAQLGTKRVAEMAGLSERTVRNIQRGRAAEVNPRTAMMLSRVVDDVFGYGL